MGILRSWSAAVVLVLAASGPGAFAIAAETSSGPSTAEFTPGLTLQDDLKNLKLALVEGYAKKHPRLLYWAQDREALKKKADAQPVLWAEVMASARRLGDTAPDSENITTGKSYWRIERVQSGALAWFVTGDKAHLDRAARWMVAHCREPVWGTGWGGNVDLHASWYLYHISLAYDTLYHELPESDRKVIRDGLAQHARAIDESLDPAHKSFRYKDGFRYDQNHTYIPAVALAAASLVLVDDVPEAMDWLKRAYAIMRRCRHALGEDGYYYEGTGYWSYALHWHVRYADLISRATGEKALELPVLRENWRYALHLALPGPPNMLDIGDIGRWKDGKRGDFAPNNYAMLWGPASALKSGEARTVADGLYAKWPDKDYPASAFLWFDPAVAPVPLQNIKPYYHFADHGFVSWRSGWGGGESAYYFRCGPPHGHAATAKLPRMKDWTMNCGHTHPDIGAFWIYAKGAYLAGDTGYTAEKFTDDHNTLLVDGVGQGVDGSYWNERGYPYAKFNEARIDKVHLADDYGFVSGEFGAAYPEAKVGKVYLRRSLLMTKRWMLVVDEMNAEQERKLTWLVHSDAAFTKQDDGAIVSRLEKAALAVVPLGGVDMDDVMEPTKVIAGESPGKGTPQERGHQLARTMKAPARSVQLVHLLAPLGQGENPPKVSLRQAKPRELSFSVNWGRGKVGLVTLDLSWQPSPEHPNGKGPAAMMLSAEAEPWN